jgi:hypothetical protein
VKVKLFTSLSGFKNRIDGKKVYAFTKDSPMRNEKDNIAVIVDVDEIEFVDDSGIITIKEKQ